MIFMNLLCFVMVVNLLIETFLLSLIHHSLYLRLTFDMQTYFKDDWERLAYSMLVHPVRSCVLELIVLSASIS